MARNVVENIFDAMVSCLLDGDSVLLPKIGTLKIVERPQRKVRNPVSGVLNEIPARKLVKFKISKTLKAAINADDTAGANNEERAR